MPYPTSPLPAGFWEQSSETLSDPLLTQVYDLLTERMRQENPEADTLEIMMIERVCFLYVYIRTKEKAQPGQMTESGTSGFAHDRVYKETMQLWSKMAQDLRVARIKGADAEKIKGELIGSVENAMKDVFAGMHPDVAGPLSERFGEAFQKNGL